MPTTRSRSRSPATTLRTQRRATAPAALVAAATDSASAGPADALDRLVTTLAASVRIEARDYQKRVVSRVIEMLSGPHADRHVTLPAARSVIVESPTGSGKTVIGLLVAKWAQECLGMRVAWTAMRRTLLAQVQRENEERGFGVDLATVSMFDRNPPAADLLVVDEAQHDATRSMATLHAAVGAKKVLGLSATPWRADRHGLCFERSVRDAGIRQLVLDGFLSPFAHHTIASYSPESVAATWLREPTRWGRSLVFFRTIAECRACAALLAAAGVACEVVTGSSDREAQIERFEQGACTVILSVAVLAEGFDCPGLETVFCRPSGKGPAVQMAGRVLRRVEGVPLKQIVQCRATKHPFTATATPAVQYVQTDDGWHSIGLNDRVERATTRMLELLVRISKAEELGTKGSARRGRRPRRPGLRAIRSWNYRLEEARDRFERPRREKQASWVDDGTW
ncbi:MAG: DEAD/DEAH box helicase [Pirellulales bacterium]